MTNCTFPSCAREAEQVNRAGQGTCANHQSVVISGSFVNDRHREGGHG